MATVTTRAGKGSALTFTQLDANFTNLNNDKVDKVGAQTMAGALTAPSFIPNSSSVPTTGIYLPASSTLGFSTGTTEQARLTSDGYLRMAANTGGIQFNGDTAATNALDDYEEGTFSPTIKGLGTAGTITYTRNNGRYTKIGNIVHVSIDIKIDAISVAPTSDLVFDSLPFTSANVEGNFCYVGAMRTNGVDLPAGAVSVFAIMLNNSILARIQVNTDNGAPTGVDGSGLSATDELEWTVSYRTA